MPSTTEINRARRGHNFLPPASVRRQTPGLYDTERVPCPDKLLHAKWFLGSTTWYAAEVDWTTGDAFGYVDDGPFSEWGYFNLHELEAATKGWLVVERDMHWTSTHAREVLR